MHTTAERITNIIATALVAVAAFQDISLMASRFDNPRILWFYLIPLAIMTVRLRFVLPSREDLDPNEATVNNRRVP